MAKAGDIALFKSDNNDFISETISFITNSQYSHVGFYVNSTQIIEAWWNNVRYKDMSNETNYDVFRFKEELSQKQIDKGVNYAVSKIGVRYDFLALLGILIEKITGTKNNYFDSRNKVICSELVSEIISEMLGYDANKEIGKNDDASVTPADLSKWGKLELVENH